MSGNAIADRSAGRGPVTRIAVPSPAFSQHPGLVERLRAKYPDAKVNADGRLLHLSSQNLIDFLKGYEAAVVALERFDDQVLEALPDLRVVSRFGVGLDKIDPHALQRHGVRLGWKPGVNSLAVAELTLCTAIMALRHVLPRNLLMRAGKRPMQMLGRQLSARVFGIHGCGHVGR